MHIELETVTAIDYYNHVEKEIDFEDTGDKDLIPYEQSKVIADILTCEVSIYLLRRATGGCGSLADNMVDMRRKLIKEYEAKYNEKYVVYNDFY